MAKRQDLNPAQEKTVYGACHYEDATGRMTCEDGMTAEECSNLNGTFYPNQLCPELSNAMARLSRADTAGRHISELKCKPAKLDCST
jgi:hypothetical protein